MSRPLRPPPPPTPRLPSTVQPLGHNLSKKPDPTLAYRQHHLHCNHVEERGRRSQVRWAESGSESGQSEQRLKTFLFPLWSLRWWRVLFRYCWWEFYCFKTHFIHVFMVSCRKDHPVIGVSTLHCPCSETLSLPSRTTKKR